MNYKMIFENIHTGTRHCSNELNEDEFDIYINNYKKVMEANPDFGDVWFILQEGKVIFPTNVLKSNYILIIKETE